LIRSGINRPERQKLTIWQLGLRKMGRSAVLPDNPAVRGMIRSVAHLVKVEVAE
jgi:large subunit ribosomal protein L30